jgi:hypothetical protein
MPAAERRARVIPDQNSGIEMITLADALMGLAP